MHNVFKAERSRARDYMHLPQPPAHRRRCFTTCVSQRISSPLEGHVHSIHGAEKEDACGLRPDSFLTHEHSTHLRLGVPPDSSSSHLLPARKWPRFSRLLGVFTYTVHWWHCQSASIAHSSKETDARTVTKAPIHLPSWWNTLQSHRSAALLWLCVWRC